MISIYRSGSPTTPGQNAPDLAHSNGLYTLPKAGICATQQVLRAEAYGSLNQEAHPQIKSLQNEAQMLINQARNLASLPYSSLQQLQQSVQKTLQLLGQAQNIAFDVQQIDQMFQQKYGSASLSASDQELIADARARWQNTVGGLQDAMRIQAGVV